MMIFIKNRILFFTYPKPNRTALYPYLEFFHRSCTYKLSLEKNVQHRIMILVHINS